MIRPVADISIICYVYLHLSVYKCVVFILAIIAEVLLFGLIELHDITFKIFRLHCHTL